MDDEGRAQIAALTAQVAAMSAAMAAMAAAMAAPREGACSIGDGDLPAVLELYLDTIPDKTKWKLSVRAMLRPAAAHFAGRPARGLTRHDWVHFRDKVRAKQPTIRRDPVTREKTLPSTFTLNQELKRWRTVYRTAVLEGWLPSNPLTDVKSLRGAKKHRETEPSDKDVHERLRPHCDAELWAFVLLGFRRGLRGPSESLKLEWQNVDLDASTIRFVEAKSRKYRALRIPSDVAAALDAIKPELPGRYVFQSSRGLKPWDPSTMWRRFRAAADAAKLIAAEGDGQVVYHDTRHAFTSGMVRKVPLPAAMRMSRHISLNAALRYMQANDDDIEFAHQKLEEGARRPPTSAPPTAVDKALNAVTKR